MQCQNALNCIDFPNNCPKFDPNGGNPDIAGIGVVWAFGATSLLTIVIAMPLMLIGLLDVLPSQKALFHPVLNILHANTPSRKANFKKKLTDFVGHIILGLSDQQLVTGLAILIVGYTKHCWLTSRHFWIVFDLAFFSSVTHLASLPALREYFTEHHRFRDLRVFLMLANYIMLLTAAVLTFRNYDEKTRNCPIQCTFEQIRGKRFGVSPIYTLQMVLLSLVFFWQLLMLYMKPDIWKARHDVIVKGRIDDAGFNIIEDYLEGQSKRLRDVGSETSLMQFMENVTKLRHLRKYVYGKLYLFHKSCKGSKGYMCVLWMVIMLLVPPAAVVWLFVLGLWGLGTARLLYDRQGSVGDENLWGFGQVLPLLLLALPFFTVIEVFQETRKPPRELSRTQSIEA